MEAILGEVASRDFGVRSSRGVQQYNLAAKEYVLLANL